MIKHPETDYIDPVDIELKEHPLHCFHVEAKQDDFPWYFDIKKYLVSRTYPKDAISNKKKSIRCMDLNFFLSEEVLYRKTPYLGLMRCVDVVEGAKLIEKHLKLQEPWQRGQVIFPRAPGSWLAFSGRHTLSFGGLGGTHKTSSLMLREPGWHA
ncbi:uncharacterized protein LOC107019507 [Solanum pennellii]|uniref:Uncharacterized protein LOC107019507 n=1 Tax=Solanum pennellii TaxID=28526 RepID=A0ABM1GSV5_SOLPN|nr:uncharacterized protein LOC107019507 [Solanum pennellii]